MKRCLRRKLEDSALVCKDVTATFAQIARFVPRDTRCGIWRTYRVSQNTRVPGTATDVVKFSVINTLRKAIIDVVCAIMTSVVNALKSQTT